MTSSQNNPTTLRELLGTLRTSPDCVMATSERLARHAAASPVSRFAAVDADTIEECGETCAHCDPLAGRSSRTGRGAFFIAPMASAPDAGLDAVKETFRAIHAGCAYLADSPMRGRALSALHLIVPAAKAMAQEGELPAAVEAILRDLGIEDALDWNNDQVRSLCENLGQRADVQGLSHLHSEAIVTAIVFGLGLSGEVRRETNAPDPWVHHKVLTEGVAIGDLPIAYMS